MENATLGFNAATMNAMHEASSAVVMCLCEVLTQEQRERLGELLGRLATNADAHGKQELALILGDMVNATR